MIYKYPEKFVVPVIYVNDLRETPMHRDWEIKYLQVESMIKPDSKMEDNHIFTINKYNQIQENINSEDVNSIFNDIDEDYANNETLNM